MHVTAKVDYAVRAAVVIGRADLPLKADEIALAEDIPAGFLRTILGEMRRGGLVTSQPGPGGGWRLARPPEQLTIAQIIRSVEGPIAQVRGLQPQDVTYGPGMEGLQTVWIAVRSQLRAVLDHTTVADLINGDFPAAVTQAAAREAAWEPSAR